MVLIIGLNLLNRNKILINTCSKNRNFYEVFIIFMLTSYEVTKNFFFCFSFSLLKNFSTKKKLENLFCFSMKKIFIQLLEDWGSLRNIKIIAEVSGKKRKTFFSSFIKILLIFFFFFFGKPKD